MHLTLMHPKQKAKLQGTSSYDGYHKINNQSFLQFVAVSAAETEL